MQLLHPKAPSVAATNETKFASTFVRTTLLLAVMLCLGVGTGLRVFHLSPRDVKPVPSVSVSAPPSHPLIKRANYPYSVIPYGVQAPEDLRNAMAGNAEIARHFEAFDFRHAKFIVLEKDSCAYVSFRKGGKINWTQSCIPLHRGELILTDGFYMIRALCGNQVSYTPQAPSAPVDVTRLGPVANPPGNPDELPAAVAAETAAQPPSSVQPPVETPVSPASGIPPITAAGGPPTFPIVMPPHGGGGCCAPATPPHRPPNGPPTIPSTPVRVPESGYGAMLLLTGVVITVGLYAKYR